MARIPRLSVQTSWVFPGDRRKGKCKVHLISTPLCAETAPQKRSGMARVVKGSHVFICRRAFVHEWHEPYLSLPSPAEAGPHLPTPDGWKAELPRYHYGE